MTDKIYNLNEIKDILNPIAKAFGVDKVYLFGSYARNEANIDSDLDFRIDKGEVRGLRFARLCNTLADAFDKDVDVVTTSSLDESFKKAISPEEVLLYAR